MTVEDTMVSDLPQFYETLSTLSTQCTGNVLGGPGQLLLVGVQVDYC